MRRTQQHRTFVSCTTNLFKSSGTDRKGSPNVFAEGIPVGRIGDPIAGCTSVAEGSPNVFANGGSGSKDNTSESLVPDDGSNFGEGGA